MNCATRRSTQQTTTCHGLRGRFALAITLATLLGTSGVHAQDDLDGRETPTRLDTVEAITPTPLPGTAVDRDALPYAVQIRNAESIREAQAGNLIQFLSRSLTGVNVNEVQGSPFQADLTYHGYRASPTLGAAQGISVYLDGVRVNEPFGDIISWDMLPEAAIRTLALIPGSDALYGLNTLGGALAFTTQSGLTAPGIGLDLSYGSDQRKRVDATWGGSNADGWHGFVAATAFDEGGWRDQSEGDLQNVFAKVGHDGERTDWDLTVLAGRSDLIGNGLLPSYRFEDGEREGGLYQDDRRAIYTAPDQTSNRQEQITAHFSHAFRDDLLLSALAYARDGRRDTVNGDINGEYEEYVEECEDGFNADGSAVDDDCEYTRDEGADLHNGVFNGTLTSQRAHGAAINLDQTMGRHQLVYGLTWDTNSVRYTQSEQLGWLDEQTRVISADPGEQPEFFSGVRGSADTVSVFIGDLIALSEATHVSAGLRWNRARVANTLTTADDGERPREAFTYTKVNPSLGITHTFADSWNVFSRVSQSNRAPTVMELGCADPEEPCRLPTGLQGDPFLEQVVARTAEAGLRFTPQTGTRVSASLYRTDNRDDILFLRAPNTQQGYFSNFEKTRHQGLDLSAAHAIGTLDLHLGYSYLEATYEARAEILAGERALAIEPGMRLAGLPKHTLKLGFEWQCTPRFSVGADTLTTSNLVVAGNEDGGMVELEEGSTARDWRIPGRSVVNLHATFKPSKELELYGGIDNLFDRHYETFGMVGEDVLPNGELLQPHIEAEDSATALFVAPGAPRRYSVGMRYSF